MGLFSSIITAVYILLLMPPVVTSSTRTRKSHSQPILYIGICLMVAVGCLFLARNLNSGKPTITRINIYVDNQAVSNAYSAHANTSSANTTLVFNASSNIKTSSGAVKTNSFVSSSKIIRPKMSGRTAEPITRRQRGTAAIIEAAKERGEKITPDFDHPSENYFSLYARPGMPVAPPPLPDYFEDDVMKALEEDIVVYDDDPAEVEELKCIVAGIKEELRAYLKDGGTVLDFVEGLKKRQHEEEQIFSNARGRIYDLYKEGDLDKAYLEWMEVNKELVNQGILPVQLPRGMRKHLAELEEKYGKGEVNE